MPKKNREKREAPGGFLLLFAGLAAARVSGAHSAGVAGADVGGFCAGLGTVYHAVDVPFRVIFGIAVLILKADGGIALELLNGVQHFLGTLVALVGILFHGLFGDLAQTGRGVGGNFRQRLRLLGNLHDGNGHRAVAIKGQTAGQHLIQHDTDRVDVGAGVGALALGLLWADIMH